MEATGFSKSKTAETFRFLLDSKQARACPFVNKHEQILELF